MPMGFCNESCFLNIVQTAHRILWSKSNSQSKHNNWRRKNAAAAACTTSGTKYGSRTGIERIPTLKVRLNLEGFKVNRRLIDFQTNQGATLNTDHNYNYKVQAQNFGCRNCKFGHHFVKQFIEPEITTRFRVFNLHNHHHHLRSYRNTGNHWQPALLKTENLETETTAANRFEQLRVIQREFWQRANWG